jgi:O-antigen ligase
MARERGMGFMYSPMSAYFLNITIVLSIAMLLVTKSLKKKVVIALIIFFMVYAHLAAVSKGGLVGLLAALSFIVLTHKIFRKYFFISVFIIAATFIIASVFVYLSWPWPEAAELFHGRKSLFPRMLIWETGFEEFVRTYGFGFGGGSFFPAHSIYLQVLFELGIPGLFIWLWLLLKLFNILKTSLKKFTDPYYRIMTICFSAGMISILTVGLVDSYYFEEIMWAFLGIGMAIINLSNRSSPEVIHA